MTMPIVLPRIVTDPASATAPNAPASQPEGDAQAAVFGAVLTQVLSHAALESSPSNPSTNQSAALDGTDFHGDATGVNEHTAASAPTLSALTLMYHPELAATSSQPASGPSPVEVAADGVLGAAVQTPDGASLDLVIDVSFAGATANHESMSRDAHGIRRGLDLVVPEFRERLERVIDRMESEFGYNVEVSETYRSQARQNALFAQGRTEPGQVVTWTRNSNHTAGRAADLVIDGTYDNPLAYERLMRIAREEGLRTLGARDPGHVELPGSGPVIAQTSPSIASQASIVSSAAELESVLEKLPNAAQAEAPRGGATPYPAAPLATVARVAAVSPVAQVARVAQVASVATVGDRGDSRVAPAADAPTLAPTVTTAVSATGISSATGMSTGGDGPADRDSSSSEPNGHGKQRTRLASAAGESVADVLRQSRDELLRAVANMDPTATSSTTAGSVDKAAVIGHTDMSERIARLLKVQDAAAERPLSQVLLRLERPDGGEDRLRVGLRGSTVSATLDVGDQAAADRLGANVKELQRALERHGFEADSLTVRSSSPNTSSNTSSRERGARHDEQRPSPDSHRHRSRREQKGGR